MPRLCICSKSPKVGEPIKIAVNPKEAKTFALRVRIPDRTTSELYTTVPVVKGVKVFKVNGRAVTPRIVKGYAVVEREWKAGDTIELELPMAPQRIYADPKNADIVRRKYEVVASA